MVSRRARRRRDSAARPLMQRIHAPGSGTGVEPGVRHARSRRQDPRRRSPRRRPRVVGPFTARWLGVVKVPLVIHDLSTGGCLILSSLNSIPATHMTLEIDLPNRTTVTVDAEAIGLRSKGFAMRFVNVP